MGKVLAIVTLVVGICATAFGIYYYFLLQKPDAGLRVESNPAATVFINGAQIGQTPIDKLYQPGEITVKIIPNSSTTNYTPYQTKVKLNSGTYTVIRRDFSGVETQTAGETVSLEKTTDRNASVSVVVAGPDAAQVVIDGEPQGLTPLAIAKITPGDHQISLSAIGFTNRTINAVAVAGYRLVINAKLAGEIVATNPPDASSFETNVVATASASIQKPYVVIQDTPTGFLRVRQTASTGGLEVGQVKPGDKLPFLDSKSGWYLVKGDFTATISGWISAQYSNKVE